MVLGLLVTLQAFPAHATEGQDVVQDLLEKSLEELLNLEVPTVYAASKREQSITNAPASVTIVTADEIAKFGYRNLAEVLGSIRGVHVIYDRNYHHIGVRGFNRPGDYDSRILKLIDGQRVNENVYGSGQSGTDSLIDLDIIERIEFVRGPGSALYGTSAFFGTINIVGGFMVTDRMLGMFVRKPKPPADEGGT
ncbi:MAG: NAD(P) transhydrogenase subunit alpha [Myxococcales bacterium]|nr:NAD(P) transhydrogenase subunit alpha [Myxococcales bacterium]